MKCKIGDLAIITNPIFLYGHIVHIVAKSSKVENVWFIKTPILLNEDKYIYAISDKDLFPIKELTETEKKDFLIDMDVLSKLLESSWQAKISNISKLQAKVKHWKNRNRRL